MFKLSFFLAETAVYTCNFVCLFVRLYPINVKTVKPIGPKLCMGPHMTPGKAYKCSELQNNVSQKKIYVR